MKLNMIDFSNLNIDKNIKSIKQEKTIGIIVARENNKFVLEYSSDKRIYQTTYLLVKSN